MNRGVLICDECCSVHRSLGRHSSQVRHLTQTPWPPSQLQVNDAQVTFNFNHFYHFEVSVQKLQFNFHKMHSDWENEAVEDLYHCCKKSTRNKKKRWEIKLNTVKIGTTMSEIDHSRFYLTETVYRSDSVTCKVHIAAVTSGLAFWMAVKVFQRISAVSDLWHEVFLQ